MSMDLMDLIFSEELESGPGHTRPRQVGDADAPHRAWGRRGRHTRRATTATRPGVPLRVLQQGQARRYLPGGAQRPRRRGSQRVATNHHIPKDSDNWFKEWFPNAIKSVKIICFISADYLRSIYCMKEFRIAQNGNNLLVVACERMTEIMKVKDEIDQYPDASDALAYLMGGGQVIFHGEEDTAAEIMKFLPNAQPEPEPAEPEPAVEPEPEPSPRQDFSLHSQGSHESPVQT